MNDIKQIKQYLEGAKTMESAAFTQRSIMDKLQQQINSMNFVKKTFSKPCKPTRRSPIRSFGEFLGIVGKSFIVPGCIYGAWFYYIASTPALTTKPLFIFYSMMTIAATALITFLIIAKKTADVSASYNEALRQYEKEMKRYEEDVEEEEERLKNLEKMKNYIIIQGKEIGKTYKSTKSSLKQYYDASSIIYPKYHNMIAINQILEYLDSKRC